jgi:hypothetical protein
LECGVVWFGQQDEDESGRIENEIEDEGSEEESGGESEE